MVATDLSEYFGRDRVFQLPASDDRTADFYTRARAFFDDSANHDGLSSRIKAGAEITVTEAPAAAKNGKDAGGDRAAPLPMFVLTPGEDLRILTAGDQPDLKAEQELIGLIKGRASPPGTHGIPAPGAVRRPLVARTSVELRLSLEPPTSPRRRARRNRAVLVGVALRELGDRLIEAVALAKVSPIAIRSPDRACAWASVQPHTFP